MKPLTLVRSLSLIAACLGAALAIPAGAAGRTTLMSLANDLGQVNASSPVEITLWMKLRDQQGLDALFAAQQDGKAAYLTTAQIRAQHAPSAADATRVAEFLKAHGFTVDGVGQDNLFVRASAPAARVASTFQVEFHNYDLQGRTFRASTRGATVPAEIRPLVAAIGGLSNLAPEPQIARVGKKAAPGVSRQTDAEGMSAHPMPLPAGTQPNGLVFAAQCLYPATTESFAGGGVSATYTGNVYGAPIANASNPAAPQPPCGYQPTDIQNAYNLTSLYKAGLTGHGTTIAIVDAYGSTTIANDVQAFSYYMGLPPANLTIIGTPTESNFSTDANAGWASETTLDVEWVHAIAPGANIVLVVTPTNSFDDLFTGDLTAASIPGVVAISNSWSGFDIGIAGDSEFYTAADGLLKAIGAAGISIDYSTGDYGDNSSQLGGLYTSTGWPASSPYATGVGGVSVGLDSHGHINFQTAWGTNLTEIVDTAALGSPPLDVPNNEGFVFGATGGVSDTYAQPGFQRGLPYTRRATPDISWVADPYTGVEIIYSVDPANDLGIEVIGGTSASCPMFTALWGIATQRAHHLLGQAAPRLYRLPPGAIQSVGPTPNSPNNVTGTITDANGTNPVHSWELSAPLFNQPTAYSALYQSPYSTRWFVITFGVDSSLQSTWGYDLATGLGVPNGAAFVNAVAESGGGGW